MFDFLSKKHPQSAEPTSPHPATSQPHSDIRRELIRVVLKDTLRQHGIPFHWLACEVIIIPRGPGEEELHIQIVILKWHEQLLRHALALQQQLLLGLDRFDPSVDHSKYMISWRISPDCGCPVAWMPDPAIWIEKAAPMVVEAPLSILDRRRTPRGPTANALEAALASTSHQDTDNFSTTQMAPLR